MRASWSLLAKAVSRAAGRSSKYPEVDAVFKKKGPSKREVLDAIEDHGKKYSGPRSGWQVKAASWVKKMHVDRGHTEVGLMTSTGQFRVLDSLRPRFVVPDLKDCKLKPYVSHKAME